MIKENKQNKLRKIKFVILALAMLILFSTVSSAIQTPLGIDGYVYELDGLTQVQKNTDMKIVNLNNNEEIHLKTGYGASGRYSIALNWPKGTNIEIFAYNSEHSISRNITLEGVIHNFNLLLNTTLPQLPPEITTQSIEDIEQLKLFKKQIEAYDQNGDKITFELLSAPSGMKMLRDTGLIYWVPKNTQQGNYEFTIVAKDNYGQSQKTFSIFVNLKQNNNQINFTNFTNSTSAETFNIKNQIRSSSSRNTKSVSNTQNTMFEKDLKEETETSTESFLSSKKEDTFEFEDKTIKEITLKNTKASKITIKEITKNTKKIERTVYKYLEIYPEIDNHDIQATIKFKVNKMWLKQKNLRPQDIQLTRFHDDKWEELKTIPLYDDSENIVLEAQTPGFSLFAITHKKEAVPNNFNENVVKIKTNNVVYGTIYSETDLSDESKLEFMFEDKKISTNIQKISNKEYIYQVNLPENIKEIKYFITNKRIIKEGTIKILGDKTEVNINLESNIFSTTINAISSMSDGKVTEILTALFITTITAFVSIFYVLRKKPNKIFDEDNENEK